MARSINNMKDLEKALQPVLLGMADELSERVYQTLNHFKSRRSIRRKIYCKQKNETFIPLGVRMYLF